VAVQTPPIPPSPDQEIEAGLIEDARARQRRHRGIFAALVAAGLLAAGLIVGFAGGGGGGSAGGRSAGGDGLPDGAPGRTASVNSETHTRRQLLQTLAVLRTSPNAADHRATACAKASRPSITFAHCRMSGMFSVLPPFPPSSPMWATWGYPRLDASLIRVVPVPRFDATLTLTPMTWQPSRSPRRVEGLDVAIAYSRGQTGSGPRPTSVATVRTHGLAISGGNATPQMRSVFGAVVVPDGIATVRLKPIRLISPPAPINPRRFGTVTTSVHDNVAAFRFAVPYVKDHHAKSLVYAVTVVARATWYGRRGNVIARTTTQLPLWLRVRGDNGPTTATN
jgi:hypothetical protein